MPKTPSNKLYKLIKSLNGSEKRYFKLYSNAKNDDKVNKYILLFDAIDLQETYDEQSLRETIYRGEVIQTRKFSELKNYLYELLLKSLQSYDAKISIDYKLKRLLQSVRVLFKRSHYNECKELLQKARILAEKYEHFISLLEILRWEKKIAYAQIDIAFLNREMERIEQEEKDALGKLQNLSALKNIFLDIWVQSSGDTTVQHEMLEAFMQKPLLEGIEKAKSYPARLLYYRIYALYYAAIGNWEKVYKTNKTLLALMDSKPEMIKEYTSEYIAGLSKLAESCVLLKQYDEVAGCLGKIRATKAVSYDDKLKIHIGYYQNKFAICIAMGAFTEGLKALEKHLAGRTEFSVKYFEKDIFYYHYFYIHFGVGDYNKALNYLNKWLALPSNIGNQNLYGLARILHLVVCYELGNKLLLEEAIRRVHRCQKKKIYLFKFENVLLYFFGKINKNKEVEHTAFLQLRKKSLELSKRPSENKIFEWFNFIAWIESKIEHQPFADVVKKYFISRKNRK